MTADLAAILETYLVRLEKELTGLSESDRAEIVLEVREHFEEASREMHDPSDAVLRNVLERLGSPEEIAAEARQRLGASAMAAPLPAPVLADDRTRANRIVPLEIVAIVLWLVWWPLGAVLSGLSPRFSKLDKLIAFLIQPLILASVASVDFVFFHATPSHWLVPFLLLLHPPTFAGIASAGYLTRKLVHPGHTSFKRRVEESGVNGSQIANEGHK